MNSTVSKLSVRQAYVNRGGGATQTDDFDPDEPLFEVIQADGTVVARINGLGVASPWPSGAVTNPAGPLTGSDELIVIQSGLPGVVSIDNFVDYLETNLVIDGGII